MEAQLEKIREAQKEAWNKSSSGWKKWDEMMMNFLKPMNTEMIQMLNLKETDFVLDVATGTGEPGLTIADVLTNGKVVGTDLAEEMLSVAKEKAINRGIKNFETVCCDVSSLPFDDNTFDAISCRLGVMFFPNIPLALQEMTRVLKPGGRVAISVWDNQEKNFWINASMETMISSLGLKPPPGAPGLFRCSQTGFIADQLRIAGLKNIQEMFLEGKLKCETIETYWNFITEVASPMAYGKAEEDLKQMIKENILNKVNNKCQNGNIEMASSSIIICGEKITGCSNIHPNAVIGNTMKTALYILTVLFILSSSCNTPSTETRKNFIESKPSFFELRTGDWLTNNWIRKPENLLTIHETFKKVGYNNIIGDMLLENPVIIQDIYINKKGNNIIDSLVLTYKQRKSGTKYYKEFWERREKELNDSVVFIILSEIQYLFKTKMHSEAPLQSDDIKLNDTLKTLLDIEYRSESLTTQFALKDFENLKRLGFHQSAYNLLYEVDKYQGIEWNRDSLSNTLNKTDKFIYPWFQDDTK